MFVIKFKHKTDVWNRLKMNHQYFLCSDQYFYFGEIWSQQKLML